jgi:hypothetical protein
MGTAFEAIDAEEQESLERDLIERYYRSGDDGGIVRLPGSGGDQKTNDDD